MKIFIRSRAISCHKTRKGGVALTRSKHNLLIDEDDWNRHYSLRRASIGSIFAARRAGI